MFPTRDVIKSKMPYQSQRTRVVARLKANPLLNSLMHTEVVDDMRASLIARLFDLHDLDNNGTIEKAELKAINERMHRMHAVREPSSCEQQQDMSQKASQVFSAIDLNADGHIDRDEFVRYYDDFLGETTPEHQAQV